MIITEKKENINNTTLKVVFRNDISEDIGEVLPFPNKHFISGNYIVYYWFISGFFGTEKSIKYINDIKSRFYITYKDNITDINHYNNKDKVNYLHKLKHFQKLKSMSINIINQTNRFDNTQDMVFWCLKLYSEDCILETGLITFNRLFDFGYEMFSNDIGTKSCKDLSTLRSKCKSIVNYYIEKEYQLDRYVRKTKTKEEWIMTRIENMLKINEKKFEDNYLKVKNFCSGMFIEEYKKKNGKWNISKLSKSLNLSRNTMYKCIDRFEKETTSPSVEEWIEKSFPNGDS